MKMSVTLITDKITNTANRAMDCFLVLEWKKMLNINQENRDFFIQAQRTP